ncbi:hypothetical protein GCM10028809_21540 [Spirosoma gilvum]
MSGGLLTKSQAQSYTLETVPNPKQSRSTHYVSNPDKILSDFAVDRIEEVLRKLEDSTTAQVAVVCVNSIGEKVPKDFATALFRKWGLGYQQKNNGLLVLLVKDQHRLEMETGYGLEGILPDAVCSRIQTQKMVPLLKVGDFDGAMINGVKEVARLISEPEAAKEVYDSSKYSGSLNSGAIMILFILLIPSLLLLRMITFFFRFANPIAAQVDKSISESKGRMAWAFLLYVVMPIVLGILVIELREPLALHGWKILLILYGYVVAVVWDARRRRLKAYHKLFNLMTEPQRYVRYRATGLSGWGNILLFPIPFGWLRYRDNQVLNELRNHDRKSANGYEMIKVTGSRKEALLTDYQKVEEQLKTVEYDVWRNDAHDITEAIGYEDIEKVAYQRCSKCCSKAMIQTQTRTVKAATKEREGRGMKDYECKACGHHKETAFTIHKIGSGISSGDYSSTTYSSSGSSFWSSSSGSSYSSSSSSSSSSWGGGSSGGGGAGSSW